MNLNVVYMTKKGSTQIIAEAIAQECGTEAYDIRERHQLGPTDLLFVGTGIYENKPDQDLLNYLDNLPVNSIRGAAVFGTSRDKRDHSELIVNLLVHKGITVYPKRFICPCASLFKYRGRPNSVDIVKARAFAREVMNAYQE